MKNGMNIQKIEKNVIYGYDTQEFLGRNYGLIDPFCDTWKGWLEFAIYGKRNFQKSIPINGIVEAIEKICTSNFKRFVIFKGEVKFYEHIFKTYKKDYIILDPKDFDKITPSDLVCLSMPFSPTASIPLWYKELCQYLEKNNIDTFIDGAYIGTINKKVYIPSTCKFFAVSCSKPFNASGLRSGILLCDKILENFKTKVKLGNYNYYSMLKSIELLDNYNCFYAYNKFRKLQENFSVKNTLLCGDSVVLSYTKDNNHHLKEQMIYNCDLNLYRLCIPMALKELT